MGLDVHQGARICAAGHGGQVLFSQATRELIGDEGIEGASISDLGEHRLKDLTRPQRLYQLSIAGLVRRFPALKTLDSRPTNLPAQATPLIGRQAEIEQVSGLLGQEGIRLLTLTGTGGIGKSRLAVHLAAECIDAFADGVFWVPLAPIRDPTMVPAAIAVALGLRESAGRTLLETLMEYLGAQAPAARPRQLRTRARRRARVRELLARRPDWTCSSPAALRCGSPASTPTRSRRCRFPT